MSMSATYGSELVLCRHLDIGQHLRNKTYTTPVTPAFKRCQVLMLVPDLSAAALCFNLPVHNRAAMLRGTRDSSRGRKPNQCHGCAPLPYTCTGILHTWPLPLGVTFTLALTH